MTITENLPGNPAHRTSPAGVRVPPGRTVAAGAFYLCMGGIHIGIAAADPSTYGPFADGSPWSFVRDGWSEVFMANPTAWALVLAAGEITLGVLLLIGGAAARVGWVAVIAFQALLVLFGWGFLFWSLPAAVVLLLGARHDWPRLGTRPQPTVSSA